MGMAREIRRSEQAEKAMGRPEHKAIIRSGANKRGQVPTLPGLPFGTSRFSSKGARQLVLDAKLTAAECLAVKPSGQQQKWTKDDVDAMIALRAKTPPATEPATEATPQ